MLRILICGINGRMGNAIYESSIKSGHSVLCGVDLVTVGKTECPVYKSIDEVKDLIDVIIDFSSPSAIYEILDYSKRNSIPLVIGTTGFSYEQEQAINSHSFFVPVFKSSNTSPGISLILKVCETLASSLKGYDVEIVEKHHSNKKDSPSGTAKLIFDRINASQNENYAPIYGRKGKTSRKKQEIGIHSIRGGSTVGEHEIYFFGENETISIKHVAHSKELFSQGVINACEFIVKKKNGLYSTDDIIF